VLLITKKNNRIDMYVCDDIFILTFKLKSN